MQRMSSDHNGIKFEVNHTRIPKKNLGGGVVKHTSK